MNSEVPKDDEDAFLLASRPWPAHAMLVHKMANETIRLMQDGGLLQPGAAERVLKMRASSTVPA